MLLCQSDAVEDAWIFCPCSPSAKLALTLRLNTATPKFDNKLRVLQEAVEERSMFEEAQRIDEAAARSQAMLKHDREFRAPEA